MDDDGIRDIADVMTVEGQLFEEGEVSDMAGSKALQVDNKKVSMEEE